MFSLRCFISFLSILAQPEIYKIRESRPRLILGDPREIVVGVRESRNWQNKETYVYHVRMRALALLG